MRWPLGRQANTGYGAKVKTMFAVSTKSQGTLFEIESGFCVAGPCAGDRLVPLRARLDEGGQVVLDVADQGGP